MGTQRLVYIGAYTSITSSFDDSGYKLVGHHLKPSMFNYIMEA